MIHLFMGNHFNNVATQDIWEYIHDGLTLIGEEVHYTFNDISRGGINIFLENFSSELADAMVAWKSQNPYSKLFIIVSEAIVNETFNSANVPKGVDSIVTSHYDNLIYWKKRYEAFIKVMKVASGIIAISECLYDSYIDSALGAPVFYLPMTALPSYRTIKQPAKIDKDIDIYFTGSETQYRSRLIESFKRRGMNVFQAHVQFPEYLRRHMLGRAKLALGLKLEETTHILSKCRAHYYLTLQCPHLFESVNDKTDLDPYLEFCDSGDIEEEVIRRVEMGSDFNFDKYERYKIDLPYEQTFLSLSAFLQNCPV